MAKAPAKHYKTWTLGEVRTLKKLAKAKLGLPKIAKQLQRTTWSVRNRASAEGISLRAER